MQSARRNSGGLTPVDWAVGFNFCSDARGSRHPKNVGACRCAEHATDAVPATRSSISSAKRGKWMRGGAHGVRGCASLFARSIDGKRASSCRKMHKPTKPNFTSLRPVTFEAHSFNYAMPTSLPRPFITPLATKTEPTMLPTVNPGTTTNQNGQNTVGRGRYSIEILRRY
jgi:hypothetical protein